MGAEEAVAKEQAHGAPADGMQNAPAAKLDRWKRGLPALLAAAGQSLCPVLSCPAA